MTARLKNTYEKEIVSSLISKLSLKNKNEVPKIVKIILNMGLGEDGADGKKLKSCIDDMSLIAGQKPIITKFKKSISNFKTRKGANAGVKVTLRSSRMYEFIDRLVNIALPRVKDFRAFHQKGLIVQIISLLVLKNILFFQKSILIKLIRLEGLMLQ